MSGSFEQAAGHGRAGQAGGLGKAAVGAVVLSAAGTACGQDALQNALAIEPFLASSGNSELNNDRPHLGPVGLELGAYAGLELNDNVNSSQLNPQSDLLLRGGLSIGLGCQLTAQSDLRFSSDIGYVHYLNHPVYDHLEVAPNSALAWNIGLQDGTISIFDQFAYSQQVLAESAISGLAYFPRFNNTIGTEVSWQPGRWILDLGYSHEDTLSSSTQFRYLNSSSELFFSRGGWLVGAASQAGIEASGGLTRYEVSTQNNNSSVSAGPYLDLELTRAVHAALRGGAVFYLFDSAPLNRQGNQLNSYYLGLRVSHQFTDFLSHKIDVQRNVRQGLNQGSSFIEQFTASYSINYSLTSNISLQGGFSYEQGTQPFEVFVDIPPFGTFGVLTTENYSRYGATVSASWQATRKVAASLGYSHWFRTSNLSGLGYEVNSVLFNLSYKF
ncbi:MAG TPA: hypothetical protein VKY92_24480 [Verrucomicrobiae bacterium]|nr:hypothetical protein [Verrucomicrobiae bacterium]